MATATARDEQLTRFYLRHADRLRCAIGKKVRGLDDATIDDACAFAWETLVRRPDIDLERYYAYWWLYKVALRQAWALGRRRHREQPIGGLAAPDRALICHWCAPKAHHPRRPIMTCVQAPTPAHPLAGARRWSPDASRPGRHVRNRGHRLDAGRSVTAPIRRRAAGCDESRRLLSPTAGRPQGSFRRRARVDV